MIDSNLKKAKINFLNINIIKILNRCLEDSLISNYLNLVALSKSYCFGNPKDF